MTVRKIKSIGDVPYPIDTHSDVLSPLLTAGAALGITGDGTDSAAWLQRVSTSDGPTTIRSIHGNTIVQDGELVPVNMTGIETTGFNQWDEQWETGAIDHSTGENSINVSTIRSKNYIPVLPSTTYYAKIPNAFAAPHYYDADKSYIGYETTQNTSGLFTTPANARYMRFNTSIAYGATYNHDICINLSDPTRNGEYEPFWSSQREIAASTYFPNGMRSAGTVRDELTADAAVTRVGVVDLGTLSWELQNRGSGKYRYRAQVSDAKLYDGTNLHDDYITDLPYTNMAAQEVENADNGMAFGGTSTETYFYLSYNIAESAAALTTAMSGHYLAFILETPTTVPIDPPLNLTYRTAAGGTERVMVPTGENSAPPTLVTAQGYTAESLRDAALSTIAPVENGTASTNYAVGSYLVHGGQLCKVTTAIATGETITIGTNVTATTAMAEVIALIAQ